MKILVMLVVTAITLHRGFAQEPPTYKPKDFKNGNLPKGMTAEQYLKQIDEERHYKIKVTFHVIGEDGLPIPDANMDVGIDSLLHSDGYNNYKGKTNASGLFIVESRGQGCSLVLVEKNGYYPSRPQVKWDGKLNPGGEEMHKNGGFRPWNPTIDVILKKIGKPIPMLVRLGNRCNSWLKPTQDMLGKELSWDLIVGDWTAPFGTGKVADLIVKFRCSYADTYNHAVSAVISLANPDDGFIEITTLNGGESLLKFPREAPADDYKLRKLEISQTVINNSLTALPAQNPKGYFLRLRTTKDKEGKITASYYGKFTKPFDLQDVIYQEHQNIILNFDYYLNPTPNDRNLEYDQKNNLAPEADKELRWPP